MLVAIFVHLQILPELGKVSLKILDLLSILELLSHELFGELLHIGCLHHLLIDKSEVLLVEFEVRLQKFHEEEDVVVDEGGQSGLSIYGGTLGVTLIGDLVS